MSSADEFRSPPYHSAPHYSAQCRCPTCGAVQTWRDECRRCHTDLTLLRQVDGEIAVTLSRFFQAMKRNDRYHAKILAKRLMQLAPTSFHRILRDF